MRRGSSESGPAALERRKQTSCRAGPGWSGANGRGWAGSVDGGAWTKQEDRTGMVEGWVVLLSRCGELVSRSDEVVWHQSEALEPMSRNSL